MGFGRYRFRRSFGNVSSQFRGARFDTYPLFTGILDDFPGAAAAYSLRALSSAWLAGDVVEVRRSSDSSTQSFTAGQVADGTLEAFCGAGDGFVSAWYDQSGQGNDATQATTTAQPQIVSSGSLVTGGLVLDGVDDYLGLSSSLGLTSGVSHFIVNTNQANNNAQIILDNRTASINGTSIRFSSANVLKLDWNASASSTTVPSGLQLFYANKTPSNLETAVNGGATTSTADATSVVVSPTPRIGARSFSAPFNFFNGSIDELIIYPSDQSANRAGIESNINEYYSIY